MMLGPVGRKLMIRQKMVVMRKEEEEGERQTESHIFFKKRETG